MDRDSLLRDRADSRPDSARSTSPGELAQAPMGGRKREREAGPDTYSPSRPLSISSPPLQHCYPCDEHGYLLEAPYGGSFFIVNGLIGLVKIF
jgi:hypothetical protein